MQCVLDYVPVEEDQYQCSMMPCKAWSISDKKCYRCDENCQQLGDLKKPLARDLLEELSCNSDCSRLVVTSSGGAAVWQNKRTGLFNFVGEHGGRPLYQKNSTLEYLFYVKGSEWLIGPDFNKAHGGEVTSFIILYIIWLDLFNSFYPRLEYFQPCLSTR